MSLAYSGSIWATVPVPRVAKCQARMKATKIAMDTIAARKLREPVILRRLPSHRLLDLEALQIFLGLCRIESLAHDDKRLRGGRRRRQSGFLHQLRSISREEHLLGDGGIVDVAFDLTPSLHLSHDPYRKGFPRKRVEVDAVRHPLHIAETVRKRAGQDLLDYGHGLIEVVRRGDRLRDLLAI